MTGVQTCALPIYPAMTLLYKSAFKLATDIKAQTLSAREVLEFFLARVEQYNPALNTVVALDIDRARARADAQRFALTLWDESPIEGLTLRIRMKR